MTPTPDEVRVCLALRREGTVLYANSNDVREIRLRLLQFLRWVEAHPDALTPGPALRDDWSPGARET